MLLFKEKIEKAIADLKRNEPPEGYYIAFSGGKDSVVMYDLVKRSGVKYIAVHNYITIEPPPLISFIEEEYPEVIIDKPKKNMAELIIYNGILPMRNRRYCHVGLKKGGEGMIKILGIRAEEGLKRRNRPYFCESRTGGGYDFNLIIDWTEQEIWRYIFTFNIKYCNLYDYGRKRIGCLFCPYGSYKQAKQDLEDFPEIADYLIDACQKAIDRPRKRRKPPKYTTGTEMFFAWLSGGRGSLEERNAKIKELMEIYEKAKLTNNK